MARRLHAMATPMRASFTTWNAIELAGVTGGGGAVAVLVMRRRKLTPEERERAARAEQAHDALRSNTSSYVDWRAWFGAH